MRAVETTRSRLPNRHGFFMERAQATASKVLYMRVALVLLLVTCELAIVNVAFDTAGTAKSILRVEDSASYRRLLQGMAAEDEVELGDSIIPANASSHFCLFRPLWYEERRCKAPMGILRDSGESYCAVVVGPRQPLVACEVTVERAMLVLPQACGVLALCLLVGIPLMWSVCSLCRRNATTKKPSTKILKWHARFDVGQSCNIFVATSSLLPVICLSPMARAWSLWGLALRVVATAAPMLLALLVNSYLVLGTDRLRRAAAEDKDLIRGIVHQAEHAAPGRSAAAHTARMMQRARTTSIKARGGAVDSPTVGLGYFDHPEAMTEMAPMMFRSNFADFPEPEDQSEMEADDSDSAESGAL